MKKKNIIIMVICLCLVAIVATVVPLTLLGKNSEQPNSPPIEPNPPYEPPETLISVIQDLDYSDDVALTYNPDQGFYKSKVFNVLPDGIFYDDGRHTADEYDFDHYDNQLFHLRMDISAFSEKNNHTSDLELTQKALDDLNTLLNNLKQKQKSAVIRFCYCPDFGGDKNLEPTLEMMKKHIAQISEILNKFESSITAIEAGMIGRWGEMNGSDITKDSAVVNEILGTWLACTHTLPILTRQPQHIYDFLEMPYEQAMSFTIPVQHEAYRLGIFDDSYLGNESDLGTFRHSREQEIQWISKQTSHLPFGGEASFETEEESLHKMESGCLDNMRALHLSYLNYGYKEDVTNYWQNQTYSAEFGDESAYFGKSVYEYIAKHFGYRFVLKNSTFNFNADLSKFKINLTLQNVGFGNLTKTKDLQLIIQNEAGEVVLRQNAGKFSGGNIEISTNLKALPAGNYKVYLSICSLENDMPTYAIAFSNAGLFSSALKANLVGNFAVK